MGTYGAYTVDIWWGRPLDDSTVADLLAYVRQKFSVVKEAAYDFVPVGLTHAMLLAESHFVIHTYPEHEYCSLDLYICISDLDLITVKNEILAIVNPSHYQFQICNRGTAKLGSIPYRKKAISHSQSQLGQRNHP